MGRLRTLLCSLCLEPEKDGPINNFSAVPDVDTTHSATTQKQTDRLLDVKAEISPESSSITTSSCTDEDQYMVDLGDKENDNDHRYNCADSGHGGSQSRGTVCPPHHDMNNNNQSRLIITENLEPSERNDNKGPVASTSRISTQNLYENPTSSSTNPPANQVQQAEPIDARNYSTNAADSVLGEPSTRLSYDIISVREPLAKVLAERQQQQQSRQNAGDHDYIEVYGERGSSCFYEEIAGSTTSSATYDQIGGNSNHNYQALTNNAYAVPTKSQATQRLNNKPEQRLLPLPIGVLEDENANDGFDLPTNRAIRNSANRTSNENNEVEIKSVDREPPSKLGNSTNAGAGMNLLDIQPARSIPIYSVINKAAKGGSKGVGDNRSSPRDQRPPQPPPKNNALMMHPSTSNSNPSYEQSAALFTGKSFNGNSNGYTSCNPSPSRSNFMVGQTKGASFIDEQADEDIYNLNPVAPEQRCSEEASQNGVRFPRPPPRVMKPMQSQSVHRGNSNATNRPLPLPDGAEHATANDDGKNNSSLVGQTEGHFLSGGCDVLDGLGRSMELTNSDNNGYEFLRSNFEDDQLDVGYEKIRDSTRGQLCASSSIPFLDNDGYESLQPIYASPSNTLADSNYEAIGPSTASELAAAAAAKLATAAALIEQQEAGNQG